MSTKKDSRAAWICTAEQLSLYPYVTNMWWQICLKIFLPPCCSWFNGCDWTLNCVWGNLYWWQHHLLQQRKRWLSQCRKPLQLDQWWNYCLRGQWGQAWELIDSGKMSCYTLCCWAVLVRRPFQAHLYLCSSLAPLDCTPSLALSFVKSCVFILCSSLGLTTFYQPQHFRSSRKFSIYETFPLGLTAAGKHTDSYLINSSSLQRLSKSVKWNEVSDFLFSCCTGRQNYPHAGLKGTSHSQRSSYLINFLETWLTKSCAHSFSCACPCFLFPSIHLTTISMGDCTGLHTWSRCLFSALFIENCFMVIFFPPPLGNKPLLWVVFIPAWGSIKIFTEVSV